MSTEPTYTLEDGTILRHGEPVGRYDLKTGEIKDLDSSLAPQVPSILKRMIADELMLESEDAVSVKQEDPTQPMEPSPPPQEVPPAPEMDPRLGDKTPAYMEWLAKFFPEDFKKRYAGRKVMGERMPPIIKEAKVPKEGSRCRQLEVTFPRVPWRRNAKKSGCDGSQSNFAISR